MEILATGLRFPEGPVALDDGTVLVVEIEGGALTRIGKDGDRSSIPCGGGPNGAAVGPDGAVYVCNNGGFVFTTNGGIRFPSGGAEGNRGGYIQRVDLATGFVEALFTEVDGVPIGCLNDIVFDAAGSCYVVDTTRGALYYANPGDRTITTVEAGLSYPNGMGLAPDGVTLYVSETYSGRVLAWEVRAPGTLGARTELYSTGGAGHWDGLAVDGAGNVCIANLENSGVTVISAGGEVLREFVTPVHDPYVTNLCFGGPGGDTAFLCSAGRGLLYTFPWPWPGLRLHHTR
jgi:gluconolactonase